MPLVFFFFAETSTSSISCQLFFYCFSKRGLFSQNHSALLLLIPSVRWTELLKWLPLIYLESTWISLSKSIDSRSWNITGWTLSYKHCGHVQSDRLLADSEIMWFLKHFDSLHCRVYCADVSILQSNSQWSIFSLYKLQFLQRGEEGTEPLELVNWYENTWKLSPLEPDRILW